MSKARDIADSAATINALDGVTATGTELNILDGVTSTTAELNILDGVTSTAAELNILDGVTSTATELNILDGVTATTTELNYVDGVTSNIQTQLDNISVTNGTLTKTFVAGEQSTITLTNNVLVPNVSVTKEVAQTGSTNNDWLVNSSSENYTRYNSAAATTLSFPAYDISSASATAAFSVSSQDNQPKGLTFSADGTKMFLVAAQGDQLLEYSLSTGFDVTTASYVRGEGVGVQARDLKFNSDGTKLFIAATQNDSIREYALSTAYDSSTMSYTRQKSVSSQDTDPVGVAFNSDGTKMFVAGSQENKIFEYAVSTGFDLSSVSYTRNYDMGSNNNNPGGMAFDSTGTKLFVARANGPSITEFSLASAFDLSSVSYVQAYDTTSTEGEPRGVAFNTDGTKMFVTGESGDEVNEYALSRSKVELGSGSFASADVGKVIEANSGVFLLTSTAGAFTQLTAPTSFSQVASGSWQLYGLKFNTTDGDLELSGNVTTDFTAATKLDDFDIGQSEGTPTGLAFNPDGTVMIVSGDAQNKIFQYTLSTGFDLTTASYASKSYDASGLDSSPRGVRFNNDGTKLMWIGESNRRVYAVPLTTAYDLSTASGYASFNISSSQTTDPTGLEFNPDGTIMYVMGRDGSDEIFQYTLTTGFDVTTASYANKKFSVSSQQGDPRGLFINSTGTKFYIVGQSNSSAYEYEMSTAYDISTASYTNNNFSHSSGTQDATAIFFSPDATGKMYILGQSNDYVVEYNILSATYPTTGYHAAHTNLSTDSTYWTDINSMTASESAGSGNIYYCVSTDDRTTWKVAKGTDGERNIAKNSSGTWQYNSNPTYGSETWTNATVNAELYAIQEAVAYSNTTTTTSGADDLASVSLTSSFSVSSQTNGPEAIQFNSTGTVMLVGDTQSSSVKEYHLSTGFDVSTASYDSQFAPGLGRIDGIAFNPDGTKMYLVSYSNASIHQYTLSTGFDVSTAGSAVGSYNVSSVQTNLRGLQINNNGTKIYTISDNDDQIEEFNLSTAYDITTASHESSTSIGTQSGNAQGFCFNGDGTILFVCDENDGGGTVYQYTLSTAYDTSTLSYASKSYVTGNAIAGVFVTSDGAKMFGAMNGDDTIKEYALQTTTSTTTFPNQMNKTQLDAIPDANHFTLANDLDLAIIMNQGSGATSLPSSDGVAINYDAAVLNQGAIHGTDYTFDAPAQNKVRITSVNAANLKVRVV